MFRTIVLCAFGAGLAACLAVTALQVFTTKPLILHAETYEDAGGHAMAAAGHDHGASAEADAVGSAEPWAPADGAERFLFTAGANFLVGIGISLVLLGLMTLKGTAIDAWRGLAWGACGFVAVALLPSLGLPPELPGTPSADLAERQLWWVATVIASGAGLALIAFGRHWAIKAAGLVLLVLPHAIGAPPAPSDEVAYPGVLAGEFVVASLAVSAVLWSVSGAAVGWLHQRLSRDA